MSLKDFIKNKKSNLTASIEPSTGEIILPNEDILIWEYENGLQVADTCGIPHMSEFFSWKRGFQNCFTGYPNDGKTLMTLFLMVVKSLQTDWKWCVWSPEMRSGTFINGQVNVNYNDLINEIIWMIDGRTPYKHIAEKYHTERIPLDEYLRLVPWIKEHFITIEPKGKKPEEIYKLLNSIYGVEGFDGILIDPFKNVEQDIRVRDDIYLEQLFATFKDLALHVNGVMNWIAHPKANVARLNSDGGINPCDQYMLNGGAAWNNSMDGIYSVLRPNINTDPKDASVNFLNLKQRKQDLTTPRGVVTNIEFDLKRHRYLFGGIDVLM
jgi:hypothetical protein